MNETVEYCPMCENHCPVSELRCGRGRAHFGLAQDGGQEGEHRHHGHEHGHGHHQDRHGHRG